MTKLAVIHISDVHVRKASDDCLRYQAAIASACFTAARSADACLIALTGDLGFSGAASEYEAISANLLKPLVEELKRETGRPVYVAIAPGNHDCTLVPPDDVRETLIDAVVQDPSKALSEPVVATCTKAQDAFFAFKATSLQPAPTSDSRLFWQQEFTLNGKCIRVSTLNAAWMSRLPETQGQLVYPIEQFDTQLGKEACLHLALVHHPFNWYNQSAYQEMRKRLRRSCTAILSGHEHQGNTGKIEELLSGTSLFFEAPALHPHEKGAQAGFNVHVFDLESKAVSSEVFRLETQNQVASNGDASVQTWSDDWIVHSALDLTTEFTAALNDPGGNFTHSTKEQLNLADIFVWPDLRVWEQGDASKPQIRTSKDMGPMLERGDRLIIYGDEKAGRTTLLLWCFRELLSRGFSPVFLAASELNIKRPEDFDKRIDHAIALQYRNPTKVQSMRKSQRILLVDDIDRIKSGLHTLTHLLEYAERHFCGICLSANSCFEVTNLTSRETAAALAPFASFELMPFGLKLRHQLIKKWCALSNVNTRTELDARVHETERIVNSVIGKRLVPEHPIYLLILLQSSEQHSPGEIQSSGLSYYYQYLITKSLGGVGVKPNELDEHFNYLSFLANRLRQLGTQEIDRAELEALTREFSLRFVTVDSSARLALLIKARLLTQRGEYYAFAYPYVYYFFLGRFLSKSLDDPTIKAWVEESCKKLYIHDRANAVMFLTHHVENKWVIQQICQVLAECFSEKKPMEFNDDTKVINELVERSAQLTIAPPDVDRNQMQARDHADQLRAAQQGNESDDYDMLSFPSKWNLLHKTAEILGVILKNYYGSLERPQKQAMIREVFDGPLRALRLWMEEIATHLPEIVNELKDIEASCTTLSPQDVQTLVNRKLFSLLSWVGTGVVAAAGNFVASDRLRDDVKAVVDGNATNAYRLIEMASRLLKPGAVQMDVVKRLASDLDRNPYGFAVLQTLGFYHMYMYHTDEVQKQALCATLKISFDTAKSIEISKPGRTLS